MAPPSLFLWRDSFQVQIDQTSDYAVLLCTYQGATYCLAPLIKPGVDPAPVLQRIHTYFHRQNQGAVFRAVPREMLSLFPTDRYRIIPDRTSWDYLYRTKDLIELRGRKYQQKRNHINRFQQFYPFTYHSLTPEHFPACQRLFEHWAAEKAGQPEVNEERLALQEAFQHFSLLKLKGGALEVYGELQAFAIGSRLNKDTAIVHFEKANAEFSGIYAVINQQFIAHEWADTKYINREDDMGLPGLRQAKERYHPFRMVEKYTVVEVGA
ncbi:MAG: DUF2156 domain-containing protein [Firmicutes bacterium]|nr:DUF2156 domain-containing protein [Bacillota bacterium]